MMEGRDLTYVSWITSLNEKNLLGITYANEEEIVRTMRNYFLSGMWITDFQCQRTI